MIHAKCSKTILISSSCKNVQDEVERRIQGKDNWVDPKSKPGKYELIKSISSHGGDRSTLAQRTTGDGSNYTDKFLLSYASGEKKDTCLVSACSESQSTSVYDYSTNFCNFHNLLCSKEEGCKVSKHQWGPSTDVGGRCINCPFHNVKDCRR